MKNKMLIFKLFLVLGTISSFKNINSMSYYAFAERVLNEEYFKPCDTQLDLRKLIEIIKNYNFDTFKRYFESCQIDINAVLIGAKDDSQEADEKENKEDNELLSEEDNGKTLLMFAVEKGDIQLIEYLISKGANVNAIKNLDTTPLSIAVLNNNLQVASLLIDCGADINQQLIFDNDDEDDRSLFDLLAQYFYQDILDITMVKLILNKGYNLYKSQVQEECGYNIIEYSLFRLDYNDSKGKEIIELLLDSTKIKIQKTDLLEIAFNKTDNDGAIKYAIEKNIIDVNSIDALDCSIIYRAAAKGNLNLVKFLLKKDADVNLLSKDYDDVEDSTALMAACQQKHVCIVKELLNAGADVTIQNANELTAYDISKKCYEMAKTKNCIEDMKIYEEIMQLLEQWNKIIAKEVMKSIANFLPDLVGIIADKVTDSSLKADELKNINQDIKGEKPLETAVKKKKRQRDSDSKILDPNDPNYNLC